MNQGGAFGPVSGLGYRYVLGHFRYFTNGTSDPAVASCTGPLARYVSSITYSATGIQTIVFKAGFNFANAPAFGFCVNAAALASNFHVFGLSWTASTRTLVIQQAQNTTGYAAAADANSYVDVVVIASDSAGK